MKILTLWMLLLSGFTVASEPLYEDHMPLMERLLVLGRMAGSCSTVNRMTTLHATAFMSGDTVFMEHFIRREAARWGLSPEEYREECLFVQGTYQRFTAKAKALGKSPK